MTASPSTPSLAWFARHEARIAWREWRAMVSAGGRRRTRTLVLALASFAIVMHLVAAMIVGPYAQVTVADHDALVAMTVTAVLAWCLVLSQAMESVTRAFYARADLDLILSSPARSRRVFMVRLAAVAGSVALMAMVMAAPFINVMAYRGGLRWLSSYLVILGLAAAASAGAMALTVGMFRAFGPRRTRLFAQIAAALIGAAFVIGLQVVAILTYGTLSRLALFQTGTISRSAPAADSGLWLPARAMLGDGLSLALVCGVGGGLLALAIAVFSRSFGSHATAAAGAAYGPRARRRRTRPFRSLAPVAALRRKEWTLLRRDVWLISQSLMQVLYLVPPALMLWLSYREGSGAMVVLVPVLVMIAGQLSGGLAWLAVSGEDAPDLVASAPVRTFDILRAKVEAVLGCVALVFLPFMLALGWVSPFHGVVATAGVLAAALSGIAIQIWFRAQARRSQFRRRQTASRLATLAEAVSSISWAGAGALAAAGSVLAVIPALIALLMLAGVRSLRPREMAA